jgi:hypothetical protein
MPRKLTTKEFIKKAQKVHGEKYDYSKVEYDGVDKKVCIVCPIHGEFWQTPHKHLWRKQGCPKCGNCFKKDCDEFISDARKVHGEKYDYSKVDYVNNKEKVYIICPKHGGFWQQPYAHLQNHGCPKCVNEANRERLIIPFDEFEKKAKKVHGGKYIYHEEHYTMQKDKTLITCPIHGDFWQVAYDHLRGHGCIKCNPLYKTNEEYIEQCRKVHNNFYNYDKTVYVNKKSKLIITCPIHGDFEQIASNHLKGCNCPKCSFSKLEKTVEKILTRNGLEYEAQKTFPWLRKMRLDFYLPKYNIGIECQGRQHFKPVDRFGGEDGFLNTNKRDALKLKLCNENTVRLLYFSDLTDFKDFLGNKIISTEKELIKEIEHTNGT